MSSLLEGQIRTSASTAMPAATRRQVLIGPTQVLSVMAAES